MSISFARLSRTALSLTAAVLALVGPSTSSLAQETLWEPLWQSAFQQDYVPGRSGIMLGSELAPGVYDLLVYDAQPGEIQASSAGTVTIHGVWDLAWHAPVSTAIDTTVAGLAVTGTAGATFTSIAATISTFNGFTAPMAAFGSNMSLHVETGGQSGDYAFSTFTPTGMYTTVEKANAAASDFAQAFVDSPPLSPSTPGTTARNPAPLRAGTLMLGPS